MNLRVKQQIVILISLFFMGSLITVGYIESERLLPKKKAKAVVTNKNLGCVKCHSEKSPGIVVQWKESRHAALGVGCMDCHQAKEGEPDAWDHEESLIAIVPTPKDCARCHEQQAKEFTAGAHADAAKNIGRLDHFRGAAAEGSAPAGGGCQKCHGSAIKVLKGGQLDPATWPNTGSGAINPDGSKGSCSVCHSRHQFAPAQARQSDTCGKCHLGAEHPQIEAYGESKHGILFRSRAAEMNLDSAEWIAGKDYTAAPTCATCHMSQTKGQPVTHDVGQRIGRALGPITSIKREGWEKKRKNMQSVCGACHGPEFVKAAFVQYDAILDRYNEKFAAPAEKIMAALGKGGKLTKAPFDEKIEWTFFELWHGNGRRPEELARRFVSNFISEAEALSPGIAARFLKGK